MVGAGVIGCCIAYYLAKAGIGVTVLERGPICAEASSANAGLVSISTREGLLLSMAQESVRLLLEAQEETGSDFELTRAGNMMLLRTEEEVAKQTSFVEKQRAAGLDVELLDPAETLRREPAVNPDVLGSVCSSLDYTINPHALTIGLARGASRAGAKLRTGLRVDALRAGSGKVTGVLTTDGEIGADVVIVAAGAWSPALLRSVGLDLPVEPSRGQILVTEPVPPITTRTVRDTGHIYVRCTTRGNYVIGSLTERVGFNKQLTPDKLRDYVREAVSLIPALAQVRIARAWAGLRPLSPDNNPFLGPVPGLDGLLLATGHSRTGIGFSAVTSRMIADVVLERKASFPLERFSISRLQASS